ncbi:uncharacterized protein MELLADRAFT_39679 [Melampsora larici-populina 98AG31]|uniref:Major facilitator superfamily (MFS) profile domain-containing protein n=1 Tax=Melampsora larici-populina (strain 98AG31 / pathotype 3-4-7) TaxID=747676 RepID=F4S487_MELLP|nr:uncharacterized protein MELLADRAFT_39679 [Melampsora larici-populina 98AG31]EGG00547.1 hypothetical protein MELLADRAFT_39679 [Melampsora larici-populina 98AG31]
MHETFRQEVVQKIDLHTIPCIMLLYLANFIDRSNIGNAKVAGLERDLHLEGVQFNIALSLFTISYIIVKIPSNHILRKVGAKIWLPFLVFCWGTITIFSAFMTNFASLIAVRMMLAVFEGGLQPGVILYLSTIYKPDELQLRFGLSYCSTALSHIVGGFLAFGIQHGMDGFAGKAAWSWIFIIEGILTLFVAAFVWYFLSSSMETAPYLTPTEREFAEASYETERGIPGHEAFEWSEVKRAFADPQVWLVGLSEASISIPLAALSIFFGMGHTGAWAQLFSALPYIPALVTVVAGALLADRWKTRGPIVLVCVPVGIAGYLMLILSKSAETRYAAFFLVVAGLFPVVPCLVCIIPINTSGVTKRATCIGIQGMIQGLSILIAPFLYIKGEPPAKGHTIALGLICCTWVLTAANVLYCRFENSRKASGRRDYLVQQYLEKFRAGDTRAPIGDRDPNFRYTL